MTDQELLDRLKSLPETAFGELVFYCVASGQEAHLAPGIAPLAARALDLVKMARADATLRASVLGRLGAVGTDAPPDPVAAWIAARALHHASLRVLGFRDRMKVDMQLDEAFVALQAYAAERDPARLAGRWVKGAPELGGLHEERDGAGGLASRTFDASELISVARDCGARGVVLLGNPGSGKTTLLKHLFVRVASGNATALGLPADTAPVYLRFTEIAGAHPAAGDLRRAIETSAEAQGHSEAGRHLFRTKRPLLILLDGLDEVRDEATRIRMCRWLDDEVLELPTAHVVATCRYAAWGRETRLGNRFLPADVLLLDEARIRQYVTRWFRAVELAVQGPRPTAEGPARAAARAEALLAILFRRDRDAQLRLRDLTGNPLLLSTICLVFHEDEDKLPEGRAELYDRCIGLLLETHTEVAKGKGDRALRAAPARRVLQPLAFAMHQQQADELPDAKVLKVIEAPLLRERELRLSPAEFLERARYDCGVLVRPDFEVCRFFHLSFQEYLAAAHCTVERLEAVLCDHAGEPRWKEVILLAMTQGGMLGPFLRVLIERGELAPNLGLVRECVQDAGRLDEQPCLELMDRVLATKQESTLARLWRGLMGQAPPVDPTDSLLAVLELLRGTELPGVNERVEALAARHPDARVRGAAVLVLGVEVPTPHADFAPGVPFRDPAAGIAMLWVAPGEFVMGSSKVPGTPNYDPEAADWELPAHRVRLTHGYFIGQYPVTNREYQAFVSARPGTEAPFAWRNARYNQPDHPVVTVRFEDALAFCAWLTEVSGAARAGWRFDLPTEAEWEFAARGTDGRKYPWGDERPDASRAHFGQSGEGVTTSEVTAHPLGRSPVGCEDMAGNVWEWTRDEWRASYGSPEPVVNPLHERSNDSSFDVARAFRGGSWSFYSWYLRCASRSRGHWTYANLDLGFRVVCRVSHQHALDP